MNRHDIEQKLPAMTQAQLVETVKTCLDMIERLENDLAVGARKLDVPSPIPQVLNTQHVTQPAIVSPRRGL